MLLLLLWHWTFWTVPETWCGEGQGGLLIKPTDILVGHAFIPDNKQCRDKLVKIVNLLQLFPLLQNNADWHPVLLQAPGGWHPGGWPAQLAIPDALHEGRRRLHQHWWLCIWIHTLWSPCQQPFNNLLLLIAHAACCPLPERQQWLLPGVYLRSLVASDVSFLPWLCCVRITGDEICFWAETLVEVLLQLLGELFSSTGCSFRGCGIGRCPEKLICDDRVVLALLSVNACCSCGFRLASGVVNMMAWWYVFFVVVFFLPSILSVTVSECA